jgi:GNAT superfamily N-acetyltransferase
VVVIRSARVGDGPAVASVFASARAEMTYLPVLHTAEEQVAFISACVAGGSWVEVAEVVPDQVVGFCAVRDGSVDHLYVTPERQGSGIGRALLNRAMAAYPLGLSLRVFELNDRARSFYFREGFVEWERTDGSGNEEQVPDIVMWWHGR